MLAEIAEFWFANIDDTFALTYDATGEVTTIGGALYYKYETTNAQGAASVMNDNATVNDQTERASLTKLLRMC